LLSCNLGDLGSDESVTFPIALLVDASATGVITNTFSVAANESELNPADNTVTEGAAVNVQADLTIH